MTQMIGRVLRQPHAQLTHKQALDECYVFTFDLDVNEAVNGVRKGLQDEGMGDLAASVKVVGGGGTQRVTKKTILNRREAFAKLPTIFLPKVLARDENAAKGYRLLDYDRDILGELDWEAFRYLQADSVMVEEQEKLKRTIARVDLDQKKEDEAKLFTHEMVDTMPDEGLDIAFLVRQLLDVVPNPWQGMRILDDTLTVLRERGVSEKRLYVNRLDLLKAMKLDLRKQVDTAAEALFREKLESGDITLRLVSSGDAKLNWELARLWRLMFQKKTGCCNARTAVILKRACLRRSTSGTLTILKKIPLCISTLAKLFTGGIELRSISVPTACKAGSVIGFIQICLRVSTALRMAS